MNNYFLTIEEAQAINNLMPGNLLFGVGSKLKNALDALIMTKAQRKWCVDAVYGDDSNDGKTWDSAFATIQTAINACGSYMGDVILVAIGSYNETVSILSTKPGICIIGVGNRGEVNLAPTTAGAEGLFNHADDVTIINLGIAGNTTGDYAIKNTGKRLRLLNCKLEGADNAGSVLILQAGTAAQIAALTDGDSSDCLVDSCEFQWGKSAIRFVSSDYGAVTQGKVTNCIFQNIVTAELAETDTGAVGSIRNLLVKDCVFDNQEDGTLPTDFINIVSAGSTGLVTGCKFATTSAIASKVHLATGVLFVDNSTIEDSTPLLRTEKSITGTVEENGMANFSVSIISAETGAIASGSIDITVISAVMSKSTGGGAFSAAGITQPTFTKSNGLVTCDYQFLLAEWANGDIYKLVVNGITATIGTEVAYVEPMIWSSILLEAKNVEGKIDTIDGYQDVPTADVATNTQMRDVIGNKTDTVAGSSIVSALLKAKQIVYKGVNHWYVDSAIAAGVDGSMWTKAFKTITAAVAAASAGDVIWLRGEFDEGAAVTITKQLTIIGENPTSNGYPTMIYNGLNHQLFIVKANNCQIRNIGFGQTQANIAIQIGDTAGQSYYKLLIDSCKFDLWGTGTYAIASGDTADAPDIQISNCLFRSFATAALQANWTRARINNNIFLVPTALTGIVHTPNGGDRPDTCILDNKFITVDVADGVGITVTNTPTAGFLFVDGNHFANFADHQHCCSKKTGYMGLNYFGITALQITT